MERFDIAIIGTGPAGISAAVTAKIRNKKILLLGRSSLSANIEKAHLIQNYPGFPEISGKDLQKAFADHLKALDISVTEDRITAVYAMGDYFFLQGLTEAYEASAVVLAAGKAPADTLPGEEKYLGRGVSYCATCDAALYKGKTAVVVSFSPAEYPEAVFLAERSEEVFYLPVAIPGKDNLGNPTDEHTDALYRVKNVPPNLHILPSLRKKDLQSISKEEHMILSTSAGIFSADGIFLLREKLTPSTLVPGLKTENGDVVTDRHMATSIPGLFACGDITGAPYQYVKSAGEGNVAALSAVNYLNEKTE